LRTTKNDFMFKTITSFFFSLIFIAFMAAPTIAFLADTNVDICLVNDINEEEKGNENFKDIEILFSDSNSSKDSFLDLKNENLLEYYFKKYSKPHLNLISPPPDLL